MNRTIKDQVLLTIRQLVAISNQSRRSEVYFAGKPGCEGLFEGSRATRIAYIASAKLLAYNAGLRKNRL